MPSTIAPVPEEALSPQRRYADRPYAAIAPGKAGGRALVIGGGFAGIAAALRRKAAGCAVTLIDRLPELGGRARTFTRDGFTFDAGPTVITAPYLLDELFQLFGESLSDHVELRPVWPWYRVQWEDGRSFDYGGDIDTMCDQIARFNRDDQDGTKVMWRNLRSKTDDLEASRWPVDPDVEGISLPFDFT